ncbi:MAG: hypothetical protein Q7S15_01945 [bacterium]|nr:hypothetical protein [bacterium]
MLRLVIDNPEQSDATVPIRWCVSQNILKELKQKRVLTPYLLLTAWHHESKREAMVRQLVPLDEAMTYVQFEKPGTHTIHATIVWPVDLQYTRLVRKTVLDRRCEIYGDGTLQWVLWPSVFHLDDRAELDVNVEKEFFAQEPWDMRYVNYFFGDKARDQCEYRRRRIVAYSFAPVLLGFVFTLFWIFKAIYVLFFLILGVRLHWDAVFDQDSHLSDIYDFEDATFEEFARDNFFLTNKGGEPRTRFLLLLHPIVIGVIAVIDIIAYHFEPMRYVAFVLVVALIIVAVLSLVWNHFIKRAAGSIKGKVLDQKMRNIETREERQLARYDQIFTGVVCEGFPLTARLADLPRAKRTVRLRLADIKAKVCRPFAR